MSTKRVFAIKKYEKPEPIEIRVIKSWIPFSQNPEVCYLFVDKYGGAIEATADHGNRAYFNSVIQVQSSYTIRNNISLPCKTYTPAVPHEASLRIGKRALFTPLSDNNIPDHFYSFASYEDLISRNKKGALLTDYIGRIERIKPIMKKGEKIMKKIIIQDEGQNTLEVTFWQQKATIIPAETTVCSIIAISSTIATEHRGKLQLESTHATTVEINPVFQDIEAHLNRLRQLPNSKELAINETAITIAELLAKTLDDKTNRFSCVASIKNIHENRNWYYVRCNECNKRLFPQIGKTLKFVCEDHKAKTNFMYCVNTTIIDDTAVTNAVFYDESMNSMLNITCEEMVTIHGYSDPKVVPALMQVLIGTPKLLHLSIKTDKSIAINKAENVEPAAVLSITPATPAAKSTTIKRHQEENQSTAENKAKRLNM